MPMFHCKSAHGQDGEIILAFYMIYLVEMQNRASSLQSVLIMHMFSSFISLSIGSVVLACETFNFAPFTNHICPLDGLLPASGHQHDRTYSGHHSKSPESSIPIAEKGPWTRKPECHRNSNESLALCVFTNTAFCQDRGISILTDESTAKMMSALPAFGVHAKAHAKADPPPYIVRALPGRGMGVIANRTIERGDQIMAYTATTIINGDAIGGPGGLEYLVLLHKAIDHLPSHSRATWLDLAAHFGQDDMYVERINTNAFSEEFDGQEHYVVIPEIAVRNPHYLKNAETYSLLQRMNHDCRPK